MVKRSKSAMTVAFASIKALSEELDTFYETSPLEIDLAPAALEEELAGLEKHWGFPLPPSYRTSLAVHNGISKIWADIPLLSSSDIITDSKGFSTFREPFPRLWKSIFACGTESYDALTFETGMIDADGEMPVIELSDEGEGRRWANFDDFITARIEQLQMEIRSEKADREQLDNQ